MRISLAILCALLDKASPIINRLNMSEVLGHFDARLGFRLFVSHDFPAVRLVLFGKCGRSGVDKIGTQVASIACWESIRTLNPKIVASVGTAGGFESKGASIGDIFLSDQYIYFDGRHILFPVIKPLRLGNFQR